MAGGGKTATTTAQTQIPPEVLSRYNSVNTRAEQTAQTPFQPYSSNPSDFVAGMNPIQGQATQGLANMGQTVANTNQMASPYFDAANYYIGMGTTNAGPKDLDINKYMSPYLQNVANPTMDLMRQEQEAQMSGQTGNAIKQGAFGGDRAGIASAVLARQNDMAKAKTYGDIMQQGYTQALGAAQQQQGVDLSARQADAARFAQAGQSMMSLGQGIGGLNLQQGQAGLGQLQALLGAGTLGQQTDQAGKTALYNQFLQERGYPFQISQFLANIAMGTGALSGQTTQTTQPAPFFSDRRLKENDEVIGETFDGLPIHRYNYKGDKRTQIGLMADEVERKKPEAVGLAAGYKTVDYDRATRAAGGGVVDDLLARQQASFGPFAQSGLYGGKSSYVPAAALPVQRLQIQSGNVTTPKSGLSEIMDAAKMATSVYDMGSGALDTGKKAYTKVSSLFGNDEDEDRIKRAAGGTIPYSSGDKPQYFPEEILDPIKPPEAPKAAKAPDAPKSPFSEILDAAKLAAKVVSMGMAKGGAVDIDPEEAAIRTIAAEIGGKSPEEARGVAAVINNRLNSGKYGDNYRDVVLAKNQFEPWNDPNGANYPLKFNQDHPRMGLAREAFQAVKSGGEDPTGGATHFYAPVAQKALGRDDPSWAAGRETMDIGPTRFVKGVDGAPVRPISSGLGVVGDTASRAVSGLGEAAKAVLPAREDGSTDWKKVLIPALTGLGAMASSNSRYLGSAMLQGLGAGAQAYAGLEKQQAGIEQTKAQTERTGAETRGVQAGTQKTIAETAAGNLVEKNGRLFVNVPDGKGGYRTLRSFEYLSLPPGQRPSLSPQSEARLREDAAKGVAPAEVVSTPLPPLAAPAAPAASGAAPKAEKPVPVEEMRPPVPTADGLSQGERQKIQTVANEVESRGGGKDEPDFFTPQNVAAKEMQNLQPQMKALAVALASTPRGQSLLTSGPQAEVLAPIAKALNGWAKTALGENVEPFTSGADLASSEAVTKAIARMKAQASQAGNQSAVSALDKMAEQFPSLLNSKQGQGKLLAEILTLQRREIDKNDYFRAYLDHARTVNPDVAVKTGREADAMFNDRYKTSFYGRDEKALEKMFNGKVKIDGKDVMDTKTGRPMSWMQYLYENGSSMSPEERQWVEKEFKAPGVLRYFGAQ